MNIATRTAFDQSTASGPLLSLDEIAAARRALGLPNRHKVSHRNHHLGLSHPDWQAMEARGLATVRRSSEDGAPSLWRLTRAAAEAALLPGERLNPDDFPA